MLWAPGYRPPAWLEQPGVAGSVEQVGIRVLGRDLEIGVWSPGEGELPLLVAHDGPEYDELAGLTRYAGRDDRARRGAAVPRRAAAARRSRRVVLGVGRVRPGAVPRILAAVARAVAVAGLPVGMGASLGALAMLQAQRTWPGTFGGLFLQSGELLRSPLRPPRVRLPALRADHAVRRRRPARRDGAEPVRWSMTCGAEEENIHNNRLMAGALAAQGYDARLAEVRRPAQLHGLARRVGSAPDAACSARLWPPR